MLDRNPDARPRSSVVYFPLTGQAAKRWYACRNECHMPQLAMAVGNSRFSNAGRVHGAAGRSVHHALRRRHSLVSDIIPAKGDDQLRRLPMNLGFAFQVLGEPATARCHHGLRRLRLMPLAGSLQRRLPAAPKVGCRLLAHTWYSFPNRGPRAIAIHPQPCVVAACNSC